MANLKLGFVSCVAVLIGLGSSVAQADDAGDYIWSQCTGKRCVIAEVREIKRASLDSYMALHILVFKDGKIDDEGETDEAYPEYTIICGNRKPSVVLEVDGDKRTKAVDLSRNTIDAAAWTYVCTGKVKRN